MMKIKSVLLLLFILCSKQISALGPFSALFDTSWDTTVQTFAQQVEKNIDELKKRRAEAVKSHAEYKEQADGIQRSLAALKERVQRSRGVEQEYYNLLFANASKAAQALSELLLVYNELKDVLDEHIKILQEYKSDPEFRTKGFYVEAKSIYSIDDFHRINETMLAVQEELKIAQERLKKIDLDYETLKKNFTLARQEYEDKKREQRDFKTKENADDKPELKKLSVKQRGALLDAEQQLLSLRKQLADAKIKVADARAQLIEQTIKIIRLQIETLESEEERVKQELRIDKKDLVATQTALKQQIMLSNRAQEDYTRRIESLNILKQNELQRIRDIKLKLNISDADIEAIYNWTYQPTSVSAWQAAIEIGKLHNHITYEIDILKETLLSQIEQEKAKIIEKELNALIINTWYKLTTGVFDGNSEEVAKEIKQYEKLKADLQGSISAITDKRTAASNTLNHNAKITENIKARIKAFREQRDTTFRNNTEEYNRLALLLKDEGFADAQRRGEIITQLIELYNTVSIQRTLAIKRIDTMIGVISAKARWRGAPPFLKGLKKFIPELVLFVRTLATTSHWQKGIQKTQQAIKTSFATPSNVLAGLFYLFGLILLYLILHYYLADTARFLTSRFTSGYGVLTALAQLLGAILHFVREHLVGLFAWAMMYLGVSYQFIDPFIGAYFYLFSIPVWLYYVRKFIKHMKIVNSTRNYFFISKAYEHRFFSILSVFLNATVVLMLLKAAIALVLPKSDAIHVLQALNFILLQVSLILMISRDQIMSLIPRNTPFWEWIYDHLNNYYYFVLGVITFVIVMSNPYIGYGPIFFYTITRLLLIALLVPLVIAVHTYIKQWLGSFFFYSDDSGVNERFKYGKTTYGFAVIASFLFFTVLAIIIAINIWGYNVGFDELWTWLHKKIYSYKPTDTGREVEVNALRLARVFLYIIGGVVVSYIFNTFVLRRMFDLLLVNVGIQNAIIALMRYVIIFTAIIIGLQSIGMSYSLFYIFAVLGGLGVAGKEIITDFIGYFIILIQRPLKIGDFVRIDPELTGVVRQLNLRSIIMRKNNSVTVIIPNSMILSKPVTNWNYWPTYFAFDDMYLTVAYAADPMRVKELILEVLHSNTNILKNPPPVVRLNDFTDNGFQFMIRGYLSPEKVLEQNEIASDIRFAIVAKLRSKGFDVGSPTRILRVIQEKPEDKNLI